jgi:cytochrome c biogenesis protein
VPFLLLASALLLGGLYPALYAFRRRLWVVAVRRPGATRTLVTVAGRAFQRPETFEDEHEAFVRQLADRLDAEPIVPADPTATSARADASPDADPDRAPSEAAP